MRLPAPASRPSARRVLAVLWTAALLGGGAVAADIDEDYVADLSAPVCRNLGTGDILQIQCGHDIAAPIEIKPSAPRPEPGKVWEASRELEDYSAARPTFTPDPTMDVCFVHHPSLERKAGSPPYSCAVTGDSKAKAAEIDAARVVQGKAPICFELGPECFGATGRQRAQAEAVAWSSARDEEAQLRATDSDADAMRESLQTARISARLRADGYELPPRLPEDKNEPPTDEARWLGRELRFEFDMTGACPAMMSFLELRGYFENLDGLGADPSVDVLVKPPIAAPRLSGHPRMPVTCSYNFRTMDWRMTGFFCESGDSCYDQGEIDAFADPTAQPDLRCRHFVREAPGLFQKASTWSMEGMDCLGLTARKKGKGEIPAFHLIALGEGVFLRVTTEARRGWQLVFAPTVNTRG